MKQAKNDNNSTYSKTPKNLFIAEKPSVAMEFAKALGVNNTAPKGAGYLEDSTNIVTWCVGHLVGMSYPEKYDPELKKWDLKDLPFLPEQDHYKYEILSPTKAQYAVVKGLLNRKDVGRIYYSGDSAREGEYIQRLVRQMAGHNPNAEEYRVWIDSQTKDEILNGIRNAKPLSAYDSLSDSAYARAIEDYGIGINFSRALTLKYARNVSNTAGAKWTPIAVGRVMSCVLGMVVRREREIRNNVKTVYYTVTGTVNQDVDTQWKPKAGSSYYKEDELFNMSGFYKKDRANQFISIIAPTLTLKGVTDNVTRKGAPLLFNLAELQGECTKRFHISPDRTLEIAQSLYENKLTTYPRTDARVLTTAIDKVIATNISGLQKVPDVAAFASEIMSKGLYQNIANTKYTNDAAVSDHYAIIPTGDISKLSSISGQERDVYIMICRRFLSIFYPQAEFEKVNAWFDASGEAFSTSAEALLSPGWMEVADKVPDTRKAADKITKLKAMKQGTAYPAVYTVNETETKPPARYTTGSMVLAMENAGKLIEDEELREQIKGSGIGTSATRAETIKKLITNRYIQADRKQVLSPTLLGEAIYEILDLCAPTTLSPEMTASWEKGLSQIVDSKVSKQLYLDKMYNYIRKTTDSIKASECGEEFQKRMEPVRKSYPGAAKVQEGTTQMTEIPCPVCGRPMRKLKTGAYSCSGYPDNCKYALWNTWCGKTLTDVQMKTLLAGKTTAEIKGFQSKAGKKFQSKLRLNAEHRIEPVFDNKK